MQCPRCSIEMDEVRKLDVIVDSCSKCGGIWLERGELDKLRAASQEARRDWEHEQATLRNGWHMSTDHPAPSGVPVLVAPDGTVYGEADLLTTAQVAEALGITSIRVRQLVERASGRKAGRDWLIPVAGMLAIAERKTGRPSKH